MPPHLAYSHMVITSANEKLQKYYKDKYSTDTSKVGVLQSKTFSHTPDEAMSGSLAKACNH